MHSYDTYLEPYVNEWQEYICPQLCERRIEQVCRDIFVKGNTTKYQEIYDAIYELVLADIEQENRDERDDA